mgnify:CR=1 FL=1|tara:strand:- start:120 stop:1346 length:1227 start_codon:yes stop_codon:yes gene_type:complete
MKVCIPSYKRYNIKTLDLLEGIDVDIFVANESEELIYREKYPNHNIIVGKLGIVEQRNFITDFYNEGEIIVSMDDDILKFEDRKNRPIKKMLEDACNTLKASPLGLMTFPPHHNSYFLNGEKQQQSYSQGKYLCVGVFHIYKNDKSLKLEMPLMEDYNRAVLYMKRDGAVLRCWDILYYHKPFNEGGLTEFRNNDLHNKCVNTMLYNNPEFVSYRWRKNSPNPQLKIGKMDTKVMKLPYTDDFNQLIAFLENTSLYGFRDNTKPAPKNQKVNNRLGFPKYRGGVLGYIYPRIGKKVFQLSRLSKLNPVLYEEVKRLGEIYCPFKFTSIQINKNLQCPPHKDKNNNGVSMLVSFGDYTGGEIVIDGETFDARENPLIFNGSELEHYNKPILSGIKYSLVFFDNEGAKVC